MPIVLLLGAAAALALIMSQKKSGGPAAGSGAWTPATTLTQGKRYRFSYGPVPATLPNGQPMPADPNLDNPQYRLGLLNDTLAALPFWNNVEVYAPPGLPLPADWPAKDIDPTRSVYAEGTWGGTTRGAPPVLGLRLWIQGAA